MLYIKLYVTESVNLYEMRKYKYFLTLLPPDVDECRTSQNTCSYKPGCRNLHGKGFRCTCRIGYHLARDTRTCIGNYKINLSSYLIILCYLYLIYYIPKSLIIHYKTNKVIRNMIQSWLINHQFCITFKDTRALSISHFSSFKHPNCAFNS